jgi:hypothetical protein
VHAERCWSEVQVLKSLNYLYWLSGKDEAKKDDQARLRRSVPIAFRWLKIAADKGAAAGTDGEMTDRVPRQALCRKARERLQ